jgi:hypothetical protein
MSSSPVEKDSDAKAIEDTSNEVLDQEAPKDVQKQ